MTPAERSAQVRKNASDFPVGSQLRALLQHAANEIDIVAAELSSQVTRLVVAARRVAFEDQGPEAIKQLDEASEEFADRVPWDADD